jgi:hypothetical protein
MLFGRIAEKQEHRALVRSYKSICGLGVCVGVLGAFGWKLRKADVVDRCGSLFTAPHA